MRVGASGGRRRVEVRVRGESDCGGERVGVWVVGHGWWVEHEITIVENNVMHVETDEWS